MQFIQRSRAFLFSNIPEFNLGVATSARKNMFSRWIQTERKSAVRMGLDELKTRLDGITHIEIPDLYLF